MLNFCYLCAFYKRTEIRLQIITTKQYVAQTVYFLCFCFVSGIVC